MIRVIVLITLSLKLFSYDLIPVENYILEDGKYKGQMFTGNITIDGLPEGQGTLMCKHDKNILNYKGFFKHGKIVKGYERKCTATTDSTGITFFIHYDGEFKDGGIWVDGGKMKLIVDTIPRSMAGPTYPSELENRMAFFGLKEVSGIHRDARSSGKRHFKGIGWPRFILDEAVFIFNNDLKGIKKRKCRVEKRDLKFCIDGVFYQEWNSGLIFDGYINETANTGTYYDGTFIWPDGTEYSYKGKKWLDSKKRSSIKKRLDLVNKRKSKKTEAPEPIVPVKPISDSSDPSIVVENPKQQSTARQDEELTPINME